MTTTTTTTTATHTNEHDDNESLVAVDGEWSQRPISIVGAVSSFVSQLRTNSDLTKIALPAAFLEPYSALELTGHRNLAHIDHLLEAPRMASGVDRFVAVLRWYLLFAQKQEFNRKPFNSVLGETHRCSTRHKVHGASHFVGEQVSHHPPVAAYHVVNATAGVTVHGNLSFGMQLKTNAVHGATYGFATVTLRRDNGALEVYEITKPLPDISVANVFIGQRRLSWTGTCSVSCAALGLRADVCFAEQSTSTGGFFKLLSAAPVENVLRGSVRRARTDQALYTLTGVCGGEIRLTPAAGAGDDHHVRVLVDAASPPPRCRVHYSPKPDDMDSIRVWRSVRKNIVTNNLPGADAAKHELEEDQRARRAHRERAGHVHRPAHFEFVPAADYAHAPLPDGDLVAAKSLPLDRVRSLQTGTWRPVRDASP